MWSYRVKRGNIYLVTNKVCATHCSSGVVVVDFNLNWNKTRYSEGYFVLSGNMIKLHSLDQHHNVNVSSSFHTASTMSPMLTALLCTHKAGLQIAVFVIPLVAKFRPYVDTAFMFSMIVGFWWWFLPVCVFHRDFLWPICPVETFTAFTCSLAGGPQVDAVFSTVTAVHSFICKQSTNKSPLHKHIANSYIVIVNQNSKQWRRKQFATGGGIMRAPTENFLMCPPLFSCAQHEVHNDCFFYRLSDIEVSPSVGSAVCTSTGEVETRGAIKVIWPSAVLCRLLGY